MNDKISFYLDSELVVRQLTGKYKIKSQHLKDLAIKVKESEKTLGCKVNYFAVPRAKNKVADALLNKKIDENY